MASIGEQLRQAREARGLSIQDVEQATHIRRVFIVALEDGRLQELPDPAYVRGFVRNYARLVGLDPDPLAEAYTRESGAHELVVPAVLDEPLFDRAGRSFKIILWVLLIALVVAAAGWAAYSYLYLRQAPWPLNQFELTALRPPTPTMAVVATATPVPPTVTPAPTVTLAPPTATPLTSTLAPTNTPLPIGTAAAVVLTTSSVAPTVEPNLTATVPPAEGLPVPEGLVVRLVATGYTWLQVFVDNQQDFLGYMNAGEERSWTGVQSVELRIGNAAAAAVEVNGVDVGPLGGADLPVTVTYTPNNLP